MASETRAVRDEPIAVVGMACRLPKASTAAEFWRMLRDGVDAIIPVPGNRHDLLGESEEGGFLEQIDAFDADFFGVSPREAATMDPQQRLFQELAWEALEHAGIVPAILAGSRTGVYVGAIWDDYATLLHRSGPGAIGAHTVTGLHRGILANRVSYRLGLRGPSMTVDTAQSSGLAAVHLACESLRAGECESALAGAVNLILAPDSTIGMARFGGLSPDRRCFTFDARANGYVRGEGGGAVMLKPLSHALRDGDTVHAVILGSAMNNDGATDALTVPSQAAQEAVLRLACAKAGVDPRQVQYVELHGTGTKAGDRTEAAALGAVLGVARPNAEPLPVGSAKTNVGHLEGAAGIVGLLKLILCAVHRELPPSLHFQAPSPAIPLGRLNLRVQVEVGPWPRPDAPLIGGVSSFGMGGTNCHVIVSDLPGQAAPARRPDPVGARPLPFIVSGRTAPALRAQAKRLSDAVDGTAPGDVAYSLATTRSAFEHRAAITAAGLPELRRGLAALAAGKALTTVVTGRTAGDPARPAFLFTGQGSQRAGMGRELHAAFPPFADAFDEVCTHVDPHLDRRLAEVVFAAPGSAGAVLLGQTRYTQPALFALETALFRLLTAFGLQPGWLAGHSVGEITAAHVAGILSLPDAAALVTARGRLMQELPPGGAMISAETTEAEVRSLLADHADADLAAVNGPAAVVISGSEEAVRGIAQTLRSCGHRTRRMRVSHAFHSARMEPMLDRLREVATGLSYAESAIPVVSNVTGRMAAGAELRTPDYWVRQARATVRFHEGIRSLFDAGATLFLELGPDAVLTSLARGSLSGMAATLIPVLRRDRPEDQALVTALGGAFTGGAPLDWHAFFAGCDVRRTTLPGYAFQRRSFWLDGPAPKREPPEPAAAGGGHLTRLAELDEAGQERELLSAVLTGVAVVLGHLTPQTVDPSRSFKDLGLTSLTAVELRDHLAQVTGLGLPASLTYDRPNPAALARHLHTLLSPATGTQAGAVTITPARGATAGGPIAIIGIGCRYPGGVSSAGDLWRLVRDGTDAVGDFPANRGWDLAQLYHPDPSHPGTTYTRQGGFVYDADAFDAEFFGISPREATAMDPQQRLLLEIAWEALEHAGIAPGTLAGSRTGVFAGATAQEYGPRLHEPAAGYEGYLLTGNIAAVVSGRLAYTLGLQGPAVTIDTACSSSLVALHLAAQSLRTGDCDLAVAGGVAVMATPGMFLEFSRQRGLAADGRCKAFAAAADGTGWSEGAGMLLLERLADARQNGHRVLAVIRGSAINQDGTSNGLSAPSGPAQESVILRALASSGLEPGEVDAVEAHGTGTTLGDTIEAGALLATYGRRPAAEPLWLGSVKSNIGHSQAAAGVAGVIKMVMAMRHGLLPKTLHVDTPTTQVDWSAGTVRLLTEPVRWPRADHPRCAAVSSFGISGTNAHLLLEEADPDDDRASPAAADGEWPADSGPLAFPVSGRTEAALRAQAAMLRGHLAHEPALEVAGVARTLSRRSSFRHRAVILAGDRAALLTGLAAVESGEPSPHVVAGTAEAAGEVVFVFPGQGSQWAGMAAGLLSESTVFRRSVLDCADALQPHLGWSLLDVLGATGPGPALEAAEVVQPALFAVMMGLAAVWRAAGVEPAAVVGHSQGEIAAACTAGALSLADAARIVALRSQCMSTLTGRGGMASLGLAAGQARELLRPWGTNLDIAAINGPTSTVVSGEADALRELLAHCSVAGVQARQVPVSYASHFRHVAEIREELLAVLAEVTPRPTGIAVYSTVTGGRIDPGDLTTGYWYRNLRETVRFAPAIRALAMDGYRTFVETSPHTVLAAGIEDTLEEAGMAQGAVVTGTLRRDLGDRRQFLTSLALCYVRGGAQPVRWPAGRGNGAAELPAYAFQRSSYWLTPAAPAGAVGSAGLASSGHPLLGAVVNLAGEDRTVFTGRLSPQTHPWLADHVVAGVTILPGTALLELALQTGLHVRELTLEHPVAVPGDTAIDIQVAVGDADGAGERPVRIYARPAGGQAAAQDWTRHASGLLSTRPTSVPAGWEPGDWPPRDAAETSLANWYDDLAAAGYSYGPAFRGLDAHWRRGDESFAEARLPSELRDEATRYAIHPALLDAVLHGAGLRATDSGPLLPFAWSDVTLSATGATGLRVRYTPLGPDRVSLSLTDLDGSPAGTVGSLTLRPPGPGFLASVLSPDGALYRVDWTPISRPASRGPAPTEITGIAGLGELRKGLSAGVPTPGTVVVRNLTGGHPAEAAGLALALCRGWLEGPFGDGCLVLVTGGAVAALPGEDVPDLAAATVWGLVRVAQTEHPGRFMIIDAPGPTDEGLLHAAIGTGEPQLALRAGAILVPRLRRADIYPPSQAGPVLDPDGTVLNPDEPVLNPDEPVLNPDGTVLITGATGTLAGLAARRLVTEHGTRRLLLVARGSEPAELCSELRALGAHTEYMACDVAERDELARVLAAVPREHPLTAVVHTAGILDDAVLTSLDDARLEAVLRPKVTGARNLHELTADLGIAAFVLFSSVAGIAGHAGQASYAAANAYLDALAQHRQAHALPATSLAWGLWAEGSKLTGHLRQRDIERMARAGVAALATGAGLALFDAALARTDAVLVPARFTLAEMSASGEIPRIFAALVPMGTTRTAPTAAGRGTRAAAWIRRVHQMPAAERNRELRDLVGAQMAAVLGHAQTDTARFGLSFRELGFDSLTAVDLRNRLRKATGLTLPSTLVFDYSSPSVLAEHLGDLMTAGPGPASPPTAIQQASGEPLAIIAMSCRYPGGVRSPEDLWELVNAGTDAIAGFPADRGWDLDSLCDPDPAARGTSYVNVGGFLYDAGDFDPALFRMSPREAVATDPQHRLLLEAAWEALERAGIDPLSRRGSQTGVFTGVMYSDYGGRFATVPGGLEGYLRNGSYPSVASGRVAYTLGLHGPAITVDTACSSSLVALHLAAQAVRAGECSMALAGGVTVMATPATFIEFSTQRGLSADGRCRSFAESADGTSFGEGVGLLLVERLSDAHRAGHPVLAVLRGSAVNQDGASNGLTAPNGGAQQLVIRQALANAGLRTQDIGAVEGHGTGTRLGDPIEAQALLATYGSDRPVGAPLWIGSVKSNIGHTQAAAGVAGVIKMVMALRHGVLPPTLHAGQPSTRVDWASGQVRLLNSARPWDRADDKPRRAGVSSFGISGTNAHVILEEAAEPPGAGTVKPGATVVLPWVLSGTDADALAAQAARLDGFVAAHPELHPADTGFSLATTRAALAERAVVLAADRASFRASLRALAAGGPASASVVHGNVTGGGAAAYLFAGQGSQRAGMGLRLHEELPEYAAAFDEVCGHLDGLLGRPVKEVLGDAASLDQTSYTQPALFAVEVALFRALEQFGLRPSLLLGHSVGELAAAHAAGVLDLPDACALVVARGRLMGAVRAAGAMAAIRAGEAEVLQSLDGCDGQIAVAAVNGPASTVISGDEQTVTEVAGRWQSAGRQVTRLRVGQAFHSPHMDEILDEFHQVAAGLTYAAPTITLISNRTGEPVGEEVSTPGYWTEHIRAPVRFLDGIRRLEREGVTWFAEIGPDGGLIPMAAECLSARRAATLVPALRRGRPERESFLALLGSAHVCGFGVDWAGLFPGACRVDLPTYAFRHERYWAEADPDGPGHTAGPGSEPVDHPLPGAVVADAGARKLLTAGSSAVRDVPAGPLPAPSRDLDVSLLVPSWTTVAAGPGADDGDYVVRELGGGGDDPPAVGAAAHAALALAKDWLAAGGREAGRSRLVVVTRGAAAVRAGDRVQGSSAAASGLLRSAQAEHPGRFVLLDVDDTAVPPGLIEAAIRTGEPQLALRGGGLHVPRLHRAPPAGQAGTTAWNPDGTVLITGGTGMAGQLVARHLVTSHGVRHLLLASRRGDVDGATASLTELGAQVTCVACDVADPAALAGLLAAIPAAHPLTGVFHAAGVLDDVTAGALTPDRLDAVLRPKAESAWHLSRLTREHDLAAFVLFSSISATIGTAGQAGYAAANAALDALARQRQDQGLPAVSLAWGLWESARGMAAGLGETGRDRLRRAGIAPLAPADALALLDVALSCSEPVLVPVRLDLAALRMGSSPLFAGLAPGHPHPAQPADDQESAAAWTRKLAGRSEEDRLGLLLGLVQTSIARALGHASPASIPAERGLMDLGLDSLTALELRNRLEAATGLTLPATLIFNYPTAAALARHLFGELPYAQSPLIAELDHLATLLPTAPVEGGHRAALARRLRELALTLDSPPQPPAAAPDRELTSASDEEIFKLIDQPGP